MLEKSARRHQKKQLQGCALVPVTARLVPEPSIARLENTLFESAKSAFLAQLSLQAETRDEAARRRFEALRQAQTCYGRKLTDAGEKSEHLVWA